PWRNEGEGRRARRPRWDPEASPVRRGRTTGPSRPPRPVRAEALQAVAGEPAKGEHFKSEPARSDEPADGVAATARGILAQMARAGGARN
ncbi:MAG: hypothetical protein KGL96_15045, partial [Hyphomicrobiales bacterium]|nr:hypothetical protein [Hyphomicrobiales bacterium]